MKYTSRFTVPAPQPFVAAFHGRSGSLVAITPPFMPMHLQQASAQLGAGDEIAFTLWLGPLSVRWRVRIGQMHSEGFTDHIIERPYKTWRHRHTFRTLDNGTTEVLDEIGFSLKPHAPWSPIGLAMTIGFPLLFFYRAWKTKQLIIRERDSRKTDVEVDE